MKVLEMIEYFEKQDDLRDYKVPRNDMTAFILLNKLIPFEDRIISHAEHDQIWLNVDIEKLANVITEDDINVLVNNGVWIDTKSESLSMFV